MAQEVYGTVGEIGGTYWVSMEQVEIPKEQ